jgi:hypothetical protein
MPEPPVLAPDRRWHAVGRLSETLVGELATLSLSAGQGEPAWLQFLNSDLSGPGEASFSPDSRYLAWTGQNGLITVADLPELRRQVQAFEAAGR